MWKWDLMPVGVSAPAALVEVASDDAQLNVQVDKDEASSGGEAKAHIIKKGSPGHALAQVKPAAAAEVTSPCDVLATQLSEIFEIYEVVLEDLEEKDVDKRSEKALTKLKTKLDPIQVPNECQGVLKLRKLLGNSLNAAILNVRWQRPSVYGPLVPRYLGTLVPRYRLGGDPTTQLDDVASNSAAAAAAQQQPSQMTPDEVPLGASQMQPPASAAKDGSSTAAAPKEAASPPSQEETRATKDVAAATAGGAAAAAPCAGVSPNKSAAVTAG